MYRKYLKTKKYIEENMKEEINSERDIFIFLLLVKINVFSVFF